MGLLGMLIAILFMILGAGYYFFSASSAPLTVENTVGMPSITTGLSRYEETRNAALDVKNLVEGRAAETMRTVEKLPTKNDERKGDMPDITDRLMASGFAVPKTERTIDTIVFHSSYDAIGRDPYAVAGLVSEYETYGVSAHYLIDRKGGIYRLVRDEHVAYHAGVAKMPDGRIGINDFSIGIEMMNTETEQYTEAEYRAVNDLVTFLKTRYPITSVVGHSDIAPGRKTDPWNFDWKKLK